MSKRLRLDPKQQGSDSGRISASKSGNATSERADGALLLRRQSADTRTDERLMEFVRILARKAARDDYRARNQWPNNDNVERI
ncbi:MULTISPECIES: hypothetical protein [Kaistia]|uniref:Uncharacterized protein n=1 Tax=Kaistia nematophila TaxID=2994654 RepID=A0A9X3E2M1_9HYPH|nr:hypothetical protein [Kaistia nematophila]MCX5570581.1 hypothetical protein [Kaistia nematophila]